MKVVLSPNPYRDRGLRVALVTAPEARGLDDDLPPLVDALVHVRHLGRGRGGRNNSHRG